MHILQALKPVTQVEMLAVSLRDQQTRGARIVLAPTTVEINGRKWEKAGLAKRIPELNNTEGYQEHYYHVIQDRIFFVRFFARVVDVPEHRQDVDAIIQSITLDEQPGERFNL